MFKKKNEEIISSEIIYTQRINNHCNLRHKNYFETPFVRTVYNGTEGASYLGPKIWDIVPEEYKTLNSLNSFEESIKNWVPLNCPCNLCTWCWCSHICILKVYFLSFVKILRAGSLRKNFWRSLILIY